ncbi:MAG: hypothetical protein ABR567_14420 [Myxococcales bacterium]|nr:hypothetical protein [Myxococcales bacterium]
MSLLPARTVSLVPRAKGFFRWALSRIGVYSRVQAPPTAPAEQAIWGFSQPILGIRALLSDLQLLWEASYPAAVLGLACALYASTQGGGGWTWFGHFYKAFATLAPLPSLIFANHYARLGALIRWRLGLGACGPREMPVGMLFGRMIRQALIVAIGVVPFAAIWNVFPGIGPILSNIVVVLWGIHWVVADAFDDAQVLKPGETLRDSINHDRSAPPPWFVRWMLKGAEKVPVLGRPLRWFARFCDYLALDSRGEIHTMEQNRLISFGFALSTAALLATPVLNLLFRPIILAGSSHLLGQLEEKPKT